MKPEILKVMDDYRAAYERTNGETISIEYERGWFEIRYRGVSMGTKHRRKEVEHFTGILQARPAAEHVGAKS